MFEGLRRGETLTASRVADLWTTHPGIQDRFDIQCRDLPSAVLLASCGRNQQHQHDWDGELCGATKHFGTQGSALVYRPVSRGTKRVSTCTDNCHAAELLCHGALLDNGW